MSGLARVEQEVSPDPANFRQQTIASFQRLGLSGSVRDDPPTHADVNTAIFGGACPMQVFHLCLQADGDIATAIEMHTAVRHLRACTCACTPRHENCLKGHSGRARHKRNGETANDHTCVRHRYFQRNWKPWHARLTNNLT